MTARHTLILDRLEALLPGVVPVGTTVFRSREDALAPEERPAVVITQGSITREPLGEGFQRCDFEVPLHIYADGTPWDAAAGAVFSPAHAAVMADATLMAIGSGPRCTGAEPDAEAADGNPGKLVAVYRFTWSERIGAI